MSAGKGDILFESRFRKRPLVTVGTVEPVYGFMRSWQALS